MFCMLKKKNYILLLLQNTTQISKKDIILLIISNVEKLLKATSEGCKAKSKGQRRWDYLTFKKLSALLKGITSIPHGDFCCLNCFHSFATKNKLESHKSLSKNKYF